MLWNSSTCWCGGAALMMVTLITEKLQNQRLDDRSRRVLQAGAYSAEKLNRSGHLFPLEAGGDKSPWPALRGGRPVGSPGAAGSTCPFRPGPRAVAHADGVLWRPESPGLCTGPGSPLDLGENSGPPVAPPTKRHCRSLSEPEELARCRSPWRPSGSKVWTPVSKRRCNSGGSATLRRCGGLGSSGLPRSPTSPLVPRPASAGSGFVDSSEGSTGLGPPWCPERPGWLSRRRLSLSQEHLADTGAHPPSASSTPTSTPELGRRHGLPRCRSQPCVLSGRRSRRKRQREEARWTRPSLDFLKMTRTLKNSKSLCSLDYEDDDEDDTQAKTVVSSPCDSQDLVGIVTPSSSPSPWACRERGAGPGGGSGDPGDWGSAGEEGVFPRDGSDLDLEQIENN
ncbi:protein FAM53A [Perognathus longimembris pacificus]|uniref:protein FAM53A n=1 Tax=Perognathus longimembris pacificus TaxID=214514 RepID=UPI002019C4B0|nr:protein FAM53A [Perognathus longimembris pacificus]